MERCRSTSIFLFSCYTLALAATSRSSFHSEPAAFVFLLHLRLRLGRHPQLYAIPETHLFIAETLHEWWDTCAKTSFNMSHGLVRAVAELFYGEQNETTVQLARAWVRRRLPFTTGYILELLAERVYPRALVEKSPSMIFHPESMQRVARMFPLARFIHLVEHPRRHGGAVVAAIKGVFVNHPAVRLNGCASSRAFQRRTWTNPRRSTRNSIRNRRGLL